MTGALAVAVGCGGPEPAAQKTTRKTAPADHHFEAAIAIHDAVSRGALADARRRAQAFAPRVDPAGFPDSWRAFLDPMWTGTTTVASAEDQALAAAGVAQMIGACGGCHHAHGVAVEAPRASEGEGEATERAATLARHAWAVNRMWDGLAGPSLRAWGEGADVLLDAPLVQLRPGVSPPDADTMRIVGEVHALAGQAHEAVDSGAMMRVYGELLATCGRCHAGGPGQPSPSSPSSASSGQRSMGSGTPSPSASQPKSQPGQPS